MRYPVEGAINNRFTAGNPQVGQQATIVEADFLNAFIEEIANVILTREPVNPAINTQLRDAIIAIATGAAGAGGGSVPTSRTVTGGGLVSGGGALVANLVLSVLQATVAETAAQTRNDVAVTPASLAGLITTQVSGGARMTKVGALYIQHFSSTASGNGSSLHNLPFAFPTGYLHGFCNGGRFGLDSSDNPPFVTGGSTTTMSVYNDINTSTSIDLLAFGY